MRLPLIPEQFHFVSPRYWARRTVPPRRHHDTIDTGTTPAGPARGVRDPEEHQPSLQPIAVTVLGSPPPSPASSPSTTTTDDVWGLVTVKVTSQRQQYSLGARTLIIKDFSKSFLWGWSMVHGHNMCLLEIGCYGKEKKKKNLTTSKPCTQQAGVISLYFRVFANVVHQQMGRQNDCIL